MKPVQHGDRHSETLRGLPPIAASISQRPTQQRSKMTKTKSSAHGDKPPKPKKQKAGSAAAKNSDTPALPGGNPLDIVNPKLLIEESRRELREQYQNAEPYLHCVMRDLFDPAALMRVRDEIINNIQATFKETDLFKVFQTGK